MSVYSSTVQINLRRLQVKKMASFYDEVEIEDFTFDDDQQLYTYPCPCGDKFAITVADLKNGDDIATCPSCSLRVKVIYNVDDFAEYE